MCPMYSTNTCEAPWPPSGWTSARLLDRWRTLKSVPQIFQGPTIKHGKVSATDIIFVGFLNANVLIFQPIPMLWPFVGIVSSRRFQQRVRTWNSVEIKGNIAKNVISSSWVLQVSAVLRSLSDFHMFFSDEAYQQVVFTSCTCQCGTTTELFPRVWEVCKHCNISSGK